MILPPMTEITPGRLLEDANHLFACALQRVGDHQHAEDLVQEFLLTAWRKRESFEGNSSLSIMTRLLAWRQG